MKLALCLTALLAAGATAVAAQPASPADQAPPPKPERACFFAENISGYTPVDDKTVNVKVGVKETYQFELLSRCQDLDWSNAIGVVSRGSSWICAGLDAELIVPSTIGPRRCMVKSIRKLSPAEVEASRKKPKR